MFETGSFEFKTDRIEADDSIGIRINLFCFWFHAQHLPVIENSNKQTEANWSIKRTNLFNKSKFRLLLYSSDREVQAGRRQKNTITVLDPLHRPLRWSPWMQDITWKLCKQKGRYTMKLQRLTIFMSISSDNSRTLRSCIDNLKVSFRILTL